MPQIVLRSLTSWLFILIALVGSAQTLQITGKVVDPNAQPISHVTVTVLSTKSTVMSNEGGVFNIAASKGDTLLFTSVGYENKTVVVANNRPLNVQLQYTVHSMEDVVIVGYGSQKRSNITGSIATVDFTELENIPQSNTLNILSGRVAGLSVIQPGSEPGADEPELYVRGVGTLNDASPLVIIDGVVATLADVGNLTPQEIREISVLKDASSAAIYGARGANGVILVTTKEPNKSKLKVSFNSYYALQEATYLSKFVESWQWLTLNAEATSMSDLQRQAIEQLKQGIYTDSTANTQWYEEIFRRAPITNYNVSVNGGNQNLSFLGSMGYQKHIGIMRGTDADRYNFRSNVKAKISEQLQAGINLWGYVKNVNGPFAASRNIINNANQSSSLTPVRYSNGDWGVYSPLVSQTVTNPVALTEIGYSREDILSANLQTYLQYQPIKSLSIRTALSYSYNNSDVERFNPTYAFPWIDGTIAMSNTSNRLISNYNATRRLQWQNTIAYNKVFQKVHDLGVLIGHEYTDNKTISRRAEGSDIPSNLTPVLNNVVNNIGVSGGNQQWRLESFFGRLNYAFSRKYLLEANLRIDGSSRFPKENRFGYFPSFSAGWVLSEESFFKEAIPQSVVNMFKIRAGYGHVGNDRIGNYAYKQVLDLGLYYNYGGNLVAAGAITQYANEKIKWETTITKNLGIDLQFLKSHFTVSFDVYERYTKDVLYRLDMPPSLGIVDQSRQPTIRNVGEVSNRGYDLTVGYNNTRGKWRYSVNGNLSYVKNKVEKLNTRDAINSDNFVSIILREGEAINSYFGYIFEDLFRTEEDLEKYPALTTTGLGLGTLRFKDVNGDGQITPEDRVVIGNAYTPYTFGLSGSVSYGNIDFNVLFQGVQGKSIYIYDNNNRPGNAANANFWKEWWDERFHPENNPNGNWPSLRRSAPDARESSSFWLKDASYVRLKNVELGYNFPSSLLKRISLSKARIYIGGQNLLTFSNLIKQLDPERATGAVDNRNYPQTRVYTLGINVTF